MSAVGMNSLAGSLSGPISARSLSGPISAGSLSEPITADSAYSA